MNERIKNYTGVSLIILLLVASYGIFQYVASYSNSVVISRSFMVSGNGKAMGIPDVAQFSFGVITEGGKDIGSLQAENSKKGNAVIGFVKSKGVESKDIQTQSYNIEPRYQNAYCPRISENCPTPEIIGYAVSQTVSVKIRDFSKIGDILSGVVEKGANSVSQLSFKIDDPASLQNEAREKAIVKAKEDALATAKAGKFRLGRLISISQGNSFPQPLYYSAAEKSAAAIEPGSQELNVTVALTYEIQ